MLRGVWAGGGGGGCVFSLSLPISPSSLPPCCLCLSVPQLIFLFSSGPPVYITQIKAQRGEDAFPACFVKPPKPIEPPASAESDITLVNDQMYFGEERVESVAIGVALEQLLQFLGDQPVVLLGHNIKRYGGHHLLREASDCGMINQLRARIHGFVDTCILFQNYAQNLESHTLEDLYEHYLSNAELFEPGEEARALQEIVDAAGISNDTLSEHFFSFAEFESRFLWKRLVFAGVITDYIMKKATRNELHFDTVRQAFAEGGEERAKDVLKQRLTKTRRILDKICRHLRENAEQ